MWMIKVKYWNGGGILLTDVKPFRIRKDARHYINNRLSITKSLRTYRSLCPVKVAITYTEITT